MIERLSITEQTYFQKHGLVILKPDTLDLFLENQFISDLEGLGLLTRYRQFIRFRPIDIAFIYPEWIGHREKFEAITENMTSGLSMILLLEYIGRGKEDLHWYIKKQKGHADQPGLRRKYIHLFEDELRQLYPHKKDFLRELNKNRIHSPEDALQALNTLVYFWPLMDREKIRQTLPDLYGIITTRFTPERQYVT